MDPNLNPSSPEGPPPGSKGFAVDLSIVKAHLADLHDSDGHCRIEECYATHNDPINHPNPHNLLYQFASLYGPAQSKPPPPSRPITRSMTKAAISADTRPPTRMQGVETRPPTRTQGVASRLSIRGTKLIMSPASGFNNPVSPTVGNRYNPYSIPDPIKKPVFPISAIPKPIPMRISKSAADIPDPIGMSPPIDLNPRIAPPIDPTSIREFPAMDE